AAPQQSPRQARPRYHASFSFAIFDFYAPLAKQNRCQYNGANTSPTRWGGTTTHLLLDRLAQANRAQSCGNELGGPGLMSFQKVTLPSAPNLYSSVPVAELDPESHAAFSKMDEGVESGSLLAALTSCGSKPPGTSVHFVTLPSAPNLNSCRPSAVLPLNQSAL